MSNPMERSALLKTKIRTDQTVISISEFVARDDFPQGAIGALVDIGGYVGTVVEVVHNSIRVRSPEGVTRGYNFYTLRKLYGPRPELEPAPGGREAIIPAKPVRAAEEPILAAEPVEPRELDFPTFDRQPKPISALISQPNFPAPILGEMVDI